MWNIVKKWFGWAKGFAARSNRIRYPHLRNGYVSLRHRTPAIPVMFGSPVSERPQQRSEEKIG